YYGYGIRDRAHILTDQKNYFNRYPQRSFEVELGGINVIRSDAANLNRDGEANSVQVSFSFRYRVSAPGKPDKTGTASDLWFLQKIDNRIQITACKEIVRRD